jgi:hypothetical protein
MQTLLEKPAPPPRVPAEATVERKPDVVGKIITIVLVVGPAVALAIALPFLWGNAINLRDVLLAVTLASRSASTGCSRTAASRPIAG